VKTRQVVDGCRERLAAPIGTPPSPLPYAAWPLQKADGGQLCTMSKPRECVRVLVRD